MSKLSALEETVVKVRFSQLKSEIEARGVGEDLIARLALDYEGGGVAFRIKDADRAKKVFLGSCLQELLRQLPEPEKEGKFKMNSTSDGGLYWMISPSDEVFSAFVKNFGRMAERVVKERPVLGSSVRCLAERDWPEAKYYTHYAQLGSDEEPCYRGADIYYVKDGQLCRFIPYDHIRDIPRYSRQTVATVNRDCPVIFLEENIASFFPPNGLPSESEEEESEKKEKKESCLRFSDKGASDISKRYKAEDVAKIFSLLKTVPGLVTELQVPCKHLLEKNSWENQGAESILLIVYNGKPRDELALLHYLEDLPAVKFRLCSNCPKKDKVGDIWELMRALNHDEPCPYLSKARSLVYSLVGLANGPMELGLDFRLEVGVPELGMQTQKKRLELRLIYERLGFPKTVATVNNPVGFEFSVDQTLGYGLLSVWHQGELPIERVNFLIRSKSVRLVGPKASTVGEALDWVWPDAPSEAGNFRGIEHGFVGIPADAAERVEMERIGKTAYYHWRFSRSINGDYLLVPPEVIAEIDRLKLPAGLYKVVNPRGLTLPECGQLN